MRNRVWINGGDIVLASLREFGDDKADIIHKYYPEEALELQEMGEIPPNVQINEGVPDGEEDDDDMDGDFVDVDQGADAETGEAEKLDDKDIDDI